MVIRWFGKEPFQAPKWAMPPATWSPNSQGFWEQNKREIQKADAANQRFDVALYGDSIVAGIDIYDVTKSIETHFPGKKFGAFGVPGNLVEGLAWRLMGGSEKPRLDPKVVVFWIGTNNVSTKRSEPHKYLEQIVLWTKKELPTSRIVILGLLRRGKYDTAPANVQLRALAKRLGVTYASCGSEMDPADKKLFFDGLHPTPAGHDVVLRCLAKAILSVR